MNVPTGCPSAAAAAVAGRLPATSGCGCGSGRSVPCNCTLGEKPSPCRCSAQAFTQAARHFLIGCYDAFVASHRHLSHLGRGSWWNWLFWTRSLRIGPRPDRIVGYAVAMGVLLILIAILTSS